MDITCKRLALAVDFFNNEGPGEPVPTCHSLRFLHLQKVNIDKESDHN